MLVLAVDDDPGMGPLFVRVATGLGMEVELATTAAAFRESFEARRPDAVILDLRLGGEDGIELLRYLSGHRYEGRILLLSGLDERLVQAAARVGAGLRLAIAGTLTKPARLPALRSALLQLRPTGAWKPRASELHAAIVGGELALHLQPIVARNSRLVVKAEALVRWQHPEHGLIPPSRFIPLVDADPSLADALTIWVVGEAGRLQCKLSEAGLDLTVAVNISGTNLRDLRFADHVAEAAQKFGAKPERLSLELTETAAFQNALDATDILLRLRIKGFELALDDFGTGFSSLKLLREIPFSTLKIDQSFVADMLVSRDAAAIVAGIIDLARRLDLQSVAEGVETEEVAQALTSLGADEMQGYLFGRPMVADQLIALGLPAARSVDATTVSAPPPQLAALTARELDVLRGLVAGKPNKAIARDLQISPRTVEVHRASMMSRLGARNLSDAIRLGLSGGLGAG